MAERIKEKVDGKYYISTYIILQSFSDYKDNTCVVCIAFFLIRIDIFSYFQGNDLREDLAMPAQCHYHAYVIYAVICS